MTGQIPTEGARPYSGGGGMRGNYTVKVFRGQGKPYYDQTRDRRSFSSEKAARDFAKSVKDADKVTIQRFDGNKWHLIE
jgi:hypothetical protein